MSYIETNKLYKKIKSCEERIKNLYEEIDPFWVTIKTFEDYEILRCEENEYKVRCKKRPHRHLRDHWAAGRRKYSLRVEGKSKIIALAKLVGLAFIPNPKNKPVVDHINGIRHDDRVENLRWATHQENNRNKKFALSSTRFKNSPKHSPYTGVTLFRQKNKKGDWIKYKKPWQAGLWNGTRHVHLGYFKTDTEAAVARDKAAKEVFGEFVRLNFPNGS